MRKPITPRIHGMIDYATVLATAAAPRVLGFPERAAALAYGMAGSYLGLSSVTDYPLSARRMVPFRTHGIAEAVSGLALPAMPWLLGFADDRRARNFFLGLTGLTFLVAALTDWAKQDSPLGDA